MSAIIKYMVKKSLVDTKTRKYFFYKDPALRTIIGVDTVPTNKIKEVLKSFVSLNDPEQPVPKAREQP